ncbi:MAG: hypothetical protein DRQ60_09615 [Gammaproteobacteria bacterium]|nr:MAG: hypothetical protein DRQ54_09475 [Gammaproteobacteria bacterium]RLA11655.1 MAG: hypothetical protein DRQ52_09235 [Gammaproteobacteria bacterium]RLA11686.1 MAG: hypothetical protein DRQ60_09615 [Gammaproteobacteria bacterium]
MKKIALSSLIGAALLASTAQAEITANVALATDYMFRGISQTDNSAAISGGFDYGYEGFYAGVWASNVDENFYPGANVEIDTYLGWGGTSNDLSYDVGFLRYNYPSVKDSDTNTNEWYGSLGYDFGVASVKGGVAFSDDFFGTGNSGYYSLGVDVPIGDYAIAVGYGHQDMDNSKSYDHYSFGVSGEIVSLGWDLTWHDSDKDAHKAAGKDNLSDGRVVFTVSKSL